MPTIVLDDLTIARAQRGNVEAQAEILARHTRVLRYLVGRFGKPAEAEDLLQELYERILAVLPRYRVGGEASLTTWIFTVAHNWLVSRGRRRGLAIMPIEEEGLVMDPEPLPDEACSARELRAQLDAAVASLPEAHRRVFVMAQVLEQPLAMVAASEGVPIGTVKSRLHRAKAALVLALGPLLDDAPGVHHA